MSSRVVLEVENLSKLYRLGTVGAKTLAEDCNRLWARMRGKEDPAIQLGRVNDREKAQRDTNYVWAVRNVNLSVNEGEILGIIGRNGQGKSTLLKLLSRITAPTTGRIRLRGRVASLLEVGTGFHPELTGRDNIYLNGAILGMKRQEIAPQIDAIVEFSGCAKFIDTPVKRYSSGMRVRLGFAVAAHLECEILIVDEVLAVGDAEFQQRCIGKMRDVASSGGRTVMLVSHNMASVANLCSRALLMEQGSVMTAGPPNEVISTYLALAGAQAQAEARWPEGLAEKGETAFCFRHLRTLGESGRPVSHITSDESLTVEIGYTVREPLPPCRVGIILGTSDGSIVFEAYDSDLRDFAGPRQPGDYTLQCVIPGNLLNSDTFLLSLDAMIPRLRKLAVAENVLKFRVEDTSESGARSSQKQKRRGVIRLPLQWHVTERTSQSSLLQV